MIFNITAVKLPIRLFRSKTEDTLTETLSDEQKALFDKFNETNSKLCDISEKEAFIRGFKLGLRFMFEAMDDSSDEFE